MIEARRLYSLAHRPDRRHLIASVFINPSEAVCGRRDKRLRKAAEGLGIHAGSCRVTLLKWSGIISLVLGFYIA